MKLSKYLLSLFTIFFFVGFNSSHERLIDQEKIQDKVKELLGKMSVEEKIGQMTQITLQAVSKTQGTKNTSHELDLQKLDEAITKYHVGSILNVYDVAHSIEYWHEVITKIQDIAAKKTNLGIPILYGIDAIHGATYTKGATLFPQAINMAATFNPWLMKKSGEITALEVRASGIPWDFYPVMDIGRQPLWPRFWETFGEDVFLASSIGSSYIEGAQGNNIGAPNKIATCLKHYLGYSFPINGKDRTPAWISERMMREYFLPTFEAGIKAGAKTIMINSSEVDGIPMHSDYHWLTEVLRGELNFKGFTVSDWEDIIRLYTRDKVAVSPKDAVRMAVMAGVDMSMVPYDFSFYNYLLELVNEGSVPMTRIDEAVSRILTVKFELGLFENPYPDQSLIKKFATIQSSDINLQAAHESIVLTKNEDGVLPLSKKIKILVAGPTANLLSVMNGGWTITWQGDEESLYPQEKLTVLEAVQKKVGSNNVIYEPGTTFNSEIDIKTAVDKAAGVDAVILCLGEKAYCESPGNINDLTLDDVQLKLADELSKTGKPIILVLLEGRPRVISRIEPRMNSVLVSMLPGMEGGRAIADIIFGDYNPDGKLPFSYPKYTNGFTTYDHKPIEEFDSNTYDPQWPFGSGLSYTRFEYSNLTLNKTSFNKGEEIKVSVTLKNAGSKSGKQTVMLYISDIVGSVSRPVKQLKGINKISLQPGVSQVVEFTITPDQLSFIGRDNKRIIEAGEFKVMIENLSAQFTLN
ncbi:MAG TPA: glycoside hydrolase family 3 N-terminal domain-containing protein [Ignavibacteriaceae bacterium]|nr:glycoside hydrolase family 3 N-terminal domain-containing protein [Ignavibacteriaceae bacterium]